MKNNFYEKYQSAMVDEKKIIDYLMNVGSSDRKGFLEKANLSDDMNGIDAVGYQLNKNQENTKIVIQIKSYSFINLPLGLKISILSNISEKMEKYYPEYKKRLICYHKTEFNLKIYNYNLDNLLAEYKKDEKKLNKFIKKLPKQI